MAVLAAFLPPFAAAFVVDWEVDDILTVVNFPYRELLKIGLLVLNLEIGFTRAISVAIFSLLSVVETEETEQRTVG